MKSRKLKAVKKCALDITMIIEREIGMTITNVEKKIVMMRGKIEENMKKIEDGITSRKNEDIEEKGMKAEIEIIPMKEIENVDIRINVLLLCFYVLII